MLRGSPLSPHQQLDSFQQQAPAVSLYHYPQQYAYAPAAAGRNPSPVAASAKSCDLAFGMSSQAEVGETEQQQQRIYHYQQQRRLEAQAHMMDRGQHHDSRSSGDASSRRGSLAAGSPGGSPSLSHRGTSVSSATSAYSPMLSSAQQQQRQGQPPRDPGFTNPSSSNTRQQDDFYVSPATAGPYDYAAEHD